MENIAEAEIYEIKKVPIGISESALNAEKNTDAKGVRIYATIGIIGYIAQSIMNGPHPLTTAMFFVLLAIYSSTLDES